MNSNIVPTTSIRKELDRIARNCQFYKEQGNRTRFVNEVGCLRGAMYIVDLIELTYPRDKYYEQFIKPCYEEILKPSDEDVRKKEIAEAEQFIADMYHCSDTWGEKTTEENMRVTLVELQDLYPDDYCPSPSLFRECAAYWNQLCDQYPN